MSFIKVRALPEQEGSDPTIVLINIEQIVLVAESTDGTCTVIEVTTDTVIPVLESVETIHELIYNSHT